MTVYENELGAVVEGLQTGRTTPTAVVETSLERYDATEGDVHAFVPEDDRPGRVRDAAAALEDEYGCGEKPPLYGVPVGVKDIFHVDGFETRAGSTVSPDAIEGPEADIVTALRDAGALVFGKTVTTEFAYFEPGPTRNPHDHARTPGGSSSGSAAAVSAGVTPLALGSQTIGSIVRPASFCGVVGVKPSYNRVPFDGILHLAESADHAGFFTQDVAGARAAARVCVDGWSEADPNEEPVLGVPDDAYLTQADDDALAAFERQRAALEAAGYEVRETDALADIQGVNARHRDLVAAEAALEHTVLYDEYGDQYAPSTVDLLTDGREVSVGNLVDARNARLALRDRLAETMSTAGIDLWIAPSAPGPAPEGIDSTGDPVMNLPWTHAGVPAMNLPGGRVDGLPVGLQVASRFGDDERLLAWASDLEAVLGTA